MGENHRRNRSLSTLATSIHSGNKRRWQQTSVQIRATKESVFQTAYSIARRRRATKESVFQTAYSRRFAITKSQLAIATQEQQEARSSTTYSALLAILSTLQEEQGEIPRVQAQDGSCSSYPCYSAVHDQHSTPSALPHRQQHCLWTKA
jgi:hypothetical protein